MMEFNYKIRKIITFFLIWPLSLGTFYFSHPKVANAALVDTGLLVRYYIDEAASGTTPTTVNDTSGVGTAMNLTINYGAGETDLAYTEVSANRGLDFLDTGGNQRADKNLAAGDKTYDGIHASKTATLEMVIDIDGVTTNNSRFFVINGRTGDNPALGLSAVAITNDFRTYFNETFIHRYSSTQIPSTRAVIHIVYDTAQATAANRLKVYVNGTLTTASEVIASITQNATFDLTLAGTNAQLIMGNRENSGAWARSFDGILYYAALYSSAFSSTDVTTNYDILTSDDDEPANPADLSWDTGAADFEIWAGATAATNASLTWDNGTLICSTALTDDNGRQSTCGSLNKNQKYRVQTVLENIGGTAATMATGDFVDQVNVKTFWAGTSPTISAASDCGFNDLGSDNTSATCNVAFNGNDVRITNTGTTVQLAATTGTEGFMYLLTTDSDVPLSNSSTYMNASIDSVTENSSMVTIGLKRTPGNFIRGLIKIRGKIKFR